MKTTTRGNIIIASRKNLKRKGKFITCQSPKNNSINLCSSLSFYADPTVDCLLPVPALLRTMYYYKYSHRQFKFHNHFFPWLE